MIIPKGETVAPSIYAFRFDGEGGNEPLWLDTPRTEIDLSRKKVWVGPFLNVRTGEKVMIRSANCGLGCHCAAEWKPFAQSGNP